MPILTAKRSTRGLSSPEISARIRPALRANDKPMMSAKQKRFHSSPSGPHQKPPSVSTPSTSKATALIGTPGSDAPQLVNDWLLAFQHALYAVSHRTFDQPHIANQAADAVGFERRCVIGAPH